MLFNWHCRIAAAGPPYNHVTTNVRELHFGGTDILPPVDMALTPTSVIRFIFEVRVLLIALATHTLQLYSLGLCRKFDEDTGAV